MRKGIKRLVATICMLALIATSFTVVPKMDVEAADAFAGYTPVTLSDFGINNGTFYGNTGWSYAVAGTLKDGSALNKKKLSINAIYNDMGATLSIGDTAGQSAQPTASRIFVNPNSTTGGLQIFTPVDWSAAIQFSKAEMGISTLEGTKINLTIGFEIVNTTDVKVTASVNDCVAKTMTVKGYASAMTNRIAAYPGGEGSSLYLESVQEDLFAGYETITLKDFGIAEGKYSFNSWAYAASKPLTSGETLNKKKTVFYATFNSSSSIITYGDTTATGFNTIRILPNVTDNTITIYSYPCQSGELTFSANDMGITALKDTKIKFAIAIEWVGTSLRVAAQINDGTAKDMLLANYPASTLGNYLGILPNASDCTITLGNYSEKSPSNLKRISWGDLGVKEEKTYTLSDVEDTWESEGLIRHFVKDEVGTLVGTAFRGYVGFEKGSAERGYHIDYGDSGICAWGIQICPQVDGTLVFKGAVNVSGAAAGKTGIQIASLDPTKFGLASFTDGNVFELGIEIWEDENPLDATKALKILIYINDIPHSLEAFVWEDAAYYGYIKNEVNFRYLNTGDAITVDFPENSPTDLRRIGWEDFGIMQDTTYTKANNTVGGQLTNTSYAGGDSVVGTSFRGTVQFNKANATSRNFMISYGDIGMNTYGLRVVPQNDGTLLVQGIDAVTSVHPVIATMNPVKVGLDSFTDGTSYTLGIDIWKDGNDLKINLFINDVQYTNSPYVWTNAGTNNLIQKNMNFCVAQDNDSITALLPETEESPEGLKSIGWEDFGIKEDTTFAKANVDTENSEGFHFKQTQDESTLVGTSFRGIISLTRSASPANTDYYYLCYGTDVSGWSGLRMNLSDGKLVVVGVGIGTAATTSFGSIDPTIAGVGNFTDTPFELGIDMWEEGNDLRFNLFFNGRQYNHTSYTWENAAANGCITCNFNLMVNGATDAMAIKLPNEEGCDISENADGYLVSGTTVRVNDKGVINGYVLKEIGDYHVVRVESDGAYATNVGCYVPGDAHPDGNKDSRDLVAIKKRAAGQKLSTTAGTFAADINKDNVVDDDDFEEIRNMLLTGTVPVSTVAAYSLRGDNVTMPIGGFCGPYGSLINDQVFGWIKDSGVNFLSGLNSVYGITTDGNEEVIKILEYADKYDLSVFVTDNTIQSAQRTLSDKEVAEAIRGFSQYKSFAGVMVIDEPDLDNYGIKSTLAAKNMANFKDASKAVNKYSNLSALVTLLPAWSSLNMGEGSYLEEYEEYLRYYCENYAPKYLAYDHYPFEYTRNAMTGANIPSTDTNRYFKNLAIARKVANEFNIPFWTCLQTGDNMRGDNESTGAPSEGQFKWQANLELAFGVKGVQYFPLVQIPFQTGTASGSVSYTQNALIGATGEKNKWYPWAQEINAQIKAIDHVLMNSTNEGIMVTNYGYAKTNMNGASECGMPIITNYNNVVTGIESTGTTYGAVAGCFDYQGKTAVYLVNYDVESTRTLTLKVNGARTYTAINRYGENTGKVSNGKLELNIEKGEAVLIVFN